MSDPSSNDQLSALKPHCHLQWAAFLDDDQRIWEITHLNGEFFLYKLHDTGHFTHERMGIEMPKILRIFASKKSCSS
jgi:hypothetical protein